MTEKLAVAIDQGVMTITLNNPEKRNAFTQEMIEAWVAALQQAREAAEVGAVVLTGAPGAFCSGGDVRAMGEREKDGTTAHGEKNRLFENLHRLNRAAEALDKPYIAAVNGVAVGAGMDVALHADIRFASESARFSEGYVKVGLVPGEGGAWYLPRLVGVGRALEMLWTGDWVSAREAERIGLVNRVYADDALLAETMAFARRLAAGPAIAIRMIKRAVYQGQSMTLGQHLDLISSHMAIIRQTEDYKNAIAAFARKETPSFRGR